MKRTKKGKKNEMARSIRFLMVSVCVGLLAAAFVAMPEDADAATSPEAKTVLSDIQTGIEEGAIEVVELGYSDCQSNFSNTVQAALNYARDRTDGRTTLIKVPNGTYQPTGRALQIYSDTILDLRGSGDSTPTETSDDYTKVKIYQTTKKEDPLTLRCGEGDNNRSSGYKSYENMYVLGGTIIGKRQNGSTASNACNVRFGHATNVNVIGTKIQDNHGGHHLEIGACKDVLVIDCRFQGAEHGSRAGNSLGNSLEAIQLDISHRENNNFAYYGANDDLPTKNVLITGCDFNNVKRGLGTHHAVYGKPYDTIHVINNTFTNIADSAIFFVYTKNALIQDNVIDTSYNGITFMYMSPKQQFQPNSGNGSAYTYDQAKNFTSSSVISNNKIHLDPSKKNDPRVTTSETKSGIWVGGKTVTAADVTENYNEEIEFNDKYSKRKIPKGVHYLIGVTVSGNTVDTGSASGSYKYNAGILAKNLASSNIKNNNINLKSYIIGESAGHAGILVDESPNIGVSKNTVKGINGGKYADGILITKCGGTKNVLVTGNSVINAPRYGINCYYVTNKTLSVWKNIVRGAAVSGIKITNSKMKNVTTNTVNQGSRKKMTYPGINVTNSKVTQVSFNKISGTASSGISVSQSSTVTKANSNTITSPGKHGIIVHGSSKITYANSNTISSPGEHGLIVNNRSTLYWAKKNKITKPKKHGVCVAAKSKGTYITSNSIITPAKSGVCVVNAGSTAYSIYGNTISTPAENGITISTSAKATYANSNKINSPKRFGVIASGKGYLHLAKSNTISKAGTTGIAATGAGKIKYIKGNTVTNPKKHGVMVYDKGSYSESIYGNKVSGASIGVLVDNNAKAYLIQANTLTSCKNRGICNNAWTNAIVSNKCSRCGKNAPYVKKGLSVAKYQVPLKKGKTCKIPLVRAITMSGLVSWSSSNKTVVTVSKFGTVKAVGKGVAFVYAKRNGVTVKAKVTVK